MGEKYEWKTVQHLASTAEALSDAAEKITQVIVKMRNANMDQALFPWAQRQWDSLDVIITLAERCESVIQSQVVAKQQGRPSQYEVTKERSVKTVARRAERNAATAASGNPPKKRGRPPKRKGA